MKRSIPTQKWTISSKLINPGLSAVRGAVSGSKTCYFPGWPNALKIIEERTHQNRVGIVNYMWTVKPMW
jgi:hypothetical protein